MKFLELLLVFCIGVSFTSLDKENREDVIYIDPGHGGDDGGCVGVDGTNEKDINLAISFELREYLERVGFVVKLTRTGDFDLSKSSSKNHKREDMIKRCELLNRSFLFASIHANKYNSKRISGAQVFYYGDKNKEFALSIQKSLKEFVGSQRKALEIEEKFLLENTSKTGCIVEVGFLSNPEELKKLKDKVYQQKIAMAIGIGIMSYLNENKKWIIISYYWFIFYEIL